MSGEQWGEAVDTVANMLARKRFPGLSMSGEHLPHAGEIHLARQIVREVAELIVADTRRKVAEEIEATFAANARSELDRPKVERGGFLGDREWAAAIARGSGNGDSGGQET